MSTEENTAATEQELKEKPVPNVDPVIASMKSSIEGLEKKNHELIGRLKQYKQIPDGVDVQELLEFKQRAERENLESEGKYTEARQALEQQYREKAEEKDKRIAELEGRIRELELITPAVSALADVVHDPELVLQTKLDANRIERNADGTVVVVDGYERQPVAEWAKNTLPEWMRKAKTPMGSGSSTNRAGGDVVAGMKNPFKSETFDLTEQGRLFRQDYDLYVQLKKAAGG